jgi:alpha-galactosidase
MRRNILLVALVLAILSSPIYAQVNGVGEKPYLGWNSFSQQTVSSDFLTQANITAQSDALRASGLQAHGFNYINMDSGWMGSFDANGRPIPNPATFPDIKALVDHIHANGQKAGIYWIPGIEQPAVDANSPILGTPYHIQDILVVPHKPGNAFSAGQTSPYHNKIDFTRPGAQEYMNSVVNLFASWGIDFIKLDGVTPGSYNNDLSIDNRDDVKAWSQAIAQSGRPIWLTVSWALDADYLSTWQAYGNARRIEDDIECEGRCSTLTDWPRVAQRFYDLPAWQNTASPQTGWNDLDSLDVGAGAIGGLTQEEQRTAVSLWAIASAPMYLGGDLTQLDSFGKSLLSNDEIIGMNQAAVPAKQIQGGFTQIWAANAGDGSWYVGLFNLNASPTVMSIQWRDLGFSNATQVRDLWGRKNLGRYPLAFATSVPGHGSRIFKVSASGNATPLPSTTYEAESGALGGNASIYSCSDCSGGAKVGYLGLGVNNNVKLNVCVARAGVYAMQIDSMTQGPRSLLFQVNNGLYNTANSGGGSFNLPSSSTVAVALKKDCNTITFGNPTSYPPDLDKIVIRGDGLALPALSVTYEAENATFAGSAQPGYCQLCSGASKAGNIGGTGTVTFANVSALLPGTYQLELDYNTSGPRTLFMTVNNGTRTQLDLNGSTFDAPATALYNVKLKAGINKIVFDNLQGYAPDIDRIVISPSAVLP